MIKTDRYIFFFFFWDASLLQLTIAIKKFFIFKRYKSSNLTDFFWNFYSHISNKKDWVTTKTYGGTVNLRRNKDHVNFHCFLTKFVPQFNAKSNFEYFCRFLKVFWRLGSSAQLNLKKTEIRIPSNSVDELWLVVDVNKTFHWSKASSRKFLCMYFKQIISLKKD